MLATFGVDVLDPAVSVRRVRVLLDRLPSGSVPAADSSAAWSIEAHLLAGVLDSIAALTWVTLRAHGAKPSKPRPVPRPGHDQPQQSDNGRVAWRDLGAALAGTEGMVRRGR